MEIRRSDCFRLTPIVNQMTKKSKKILITTEKHEITFIRRNKEKPFNVFCPKCECSVEMVDLDSAVGLTGHRASKLLEDQDIHSFETLDGYVLFCINF